MKFYTHFTLHDRACLQLFLDKKMSLREIARQMEKNVSTISREIKRNTDKNGKYIPTQAQKQYEKRRKSSVRKHRFIYENDLIKFTLEGLSQYWSPEIIAAKWKQCNLGAKLSPVTLYKAIKEKLFENITPKTHLRRRGKKKYEKRSKFNTIQPDWLIKDWLPEILSRSRVGDWEGDTVHGAKGKGGLVTLVDRKTRFLVAILITDFSSLQTKEAIITGLSGHKVESISLDNGSEFALHKQIGQALSSKVYFADPHSPWQRGSNENLNGLLRFFFPKGCNFLEVTQEELNKVVDLINNRPRKCLGYYAPSEILAKCCA